MLAADTIVELDGEVLGKPAEAAEARRHAAPAARPPPPGHHGLGPGRPRRRVGDAGAVATEVVMVDAGDAEVDDYVASGEWRGKAGGYAVQGIAAALVAEVHGSITNVVGLPLAEVAAALRRAGAPAPRLAAGRAA